METKVKTHDLSGIISKKLNLDKKNVETVISFYNEKATIPFVARYRKDQTGNLDEVKLSETYDAIKYYNELFDRKAFILEEIEKKGKLTPQLREKIEKCFDAKKLEDLYLPYKEKKKTKAEKAREAGIEPLAKMLMSLEDLGDPLEKAIEFINEEKGYDTAQKVIEGALYIIAQDVIESTDLMEIFLKNAFKDGKLVSKKKKGYEGEEKRFEDYYEYEEELSRLKLPKSTHRFLAIQRGNNLKVLSIKLDLKDEFNIMLLKKRYMTRDFFYVDYIEEAVDIAYKKYLRSALDNRIMSELTEIAETEAINVFKRNLESALLAPPLPYKNVLGLDPGLRTGVKTAILDKDGTFRGNLVLHINTESQLKKSMDVLEKLMKKYDIGAISIGNGTGSRETLALVKGFTKKAGLKPIIAVVNESGASVYSASKLAREEFPDLDITVRGAISIGRRLQNPLAELVKIDPRSIGVGQYQHDVNQKKLKEALERVIEFCVNKVGVDINTASYSILTYISGLTAKTAKNIIEYRRENGLFKSRAQIKKAKGIGPKSFEQCAGFLMLRDGNNPLDNTRVHPESYPIVKAIAKDHKMTTDQVIGNKLLFKTIDPSDYLTDTYQIHNFRSLVDDLKHPGQDPRKTFVNISYKEGVETIQDVKKEMVLEGRVTNVTNFGAFIDIGVHQDGLCHVSQMADYFVKDPNDVVAVGDIVTVEVLNVDCQRRRISLKIL
ncbi:MAG: helix-hairpin-helix domain-containing protein [Candidatus Eremiobacteraeota bacterium]|nr:helix-hairpin-helix domain-containing protein [Candidatus Eremiobacteraeota bacterium]